MGVHTQDIIQIFFKDEGKGVDLGNVELKTSQGKDNRFTIHEKDYIHPEYVVFYSINKDTWFFTKKELLNKFVPLNYKLGHEKRKVSINQLYNFAYMITSDEMNMMNEMEQIVKNPKKYLNWVE